MANKTCVLNECDVFGQGYHDEMYYYCKRNIDLHSMFTTTRPELLKYTKLAEKILEFFKEFERRPDTL